VKVPTSALLFRAEGLRIAVVGADNKIERTKVTLGRNRAALRSRRPTGVASKQE
jgi:hypothetical protein